MATHSDIIAWRIPWTEEPGKLQSRRVANNQTRLSTHTNNPHTLFLLPTKLAPPSYLYAFQPLACHLFREPTLPTLLYNITCSHSNQSSHPTPLSPVELKSSNTLPSLHTSRLHSPYSLQGSLEVEALCAVFTKGHGAQSRASHPVGTQNIYFFFNKQDW